MTFVSYAQNFEDVMLWRALRHVQCGFYIDVGAAEPDRDSVTRAFYERGWNGINVEPAHASMLRIAATRLRDVNLPVVLGRDSGTATLHVVAGTGLSTVHEESLPAIRRAGFVSEAVRVEIATLAEVCRAHVAGRADEAIHFLKIDVEGAEADVIAGADFKRFRPWIVLVEATAPMSAEQTHGEWEPALLAADYLFAYFDGLNRFYVAAEHSDALMPHLMVPPNVFDDFIRVADTDAARQIAEADLRTRDAFDHVRAAEQRALAVSAATAEANALAWARARDVAALNQALHAEQVARAHERGALRAAELSLQTIRQSTSWRVTSPLRRAVSAARRSPPAAEAPRLMDDAATEPPGRTPERPRRSRRLRRAVHQFHSGSATGDAVTNSMLLIRTLLRAEGYASEIFVEHVDPALAGDLRTIDVLPDHDDYVLIVHHSMGYDAFERIAGLAAPKVLYYHNITPSPLLDGMPESQRYAAIGRAQLATLKGRVAATLAVSEYNAIELRSLGFEDARAAMLLFDVDALVARVARPADARRTEAFTVLFVGRVILSKAQHELIKAYAAFARAYPRPSRLVVVGRHGGANDLYVARLAALIRDEGLEGQVTLTGLVSEAELHEWYRAADLYVSFSRHEGFGVPLVEAIAHGVPVLARPSGGVPYTLDGVAEFFAGAGADEAVSLMLALATDEQRRATLSARASAALGRFSLDRQKIPLLRALAAAGAMPPEDAEFAAHLAANMRFTIAGHVNGSYSLAAINRDLARALEAARPGAARLVAIEGEATGDLAGVPAGELADVARLAARGKPDTGPELVISQHYPVHAPTDRGDVCAALFFWEETVVPAETVAELNDEFDGVLAPSRFVAKTLVDSGVHVPVRTIGHAPDLAAFKQLRDERARRTPGSSFTFLHVSSGFPRKGVDVLLAAYARAFRGGDPVRLVIKVFPNPHNDVADQIARLRAADAGISDIELIDRDLPSDELLALYRDADAIVLPTRGEGYNLPAAEAIAAGIPLIVTGFGGHMDFCEPDRVRLLGYRMAHSKSHLATPHSLWAEPDVDDLVAALTEAVDRRVVNGERARTPSSAFAEASDPSDLLRRVSRAGADLLTAGHDVRTRVAWVSTWGVRCGVAEYSRHLVTAMTATHPSLDVTVLCDRRSASDETGPTVRAVWDLGYGDLDVAQIATGIAKSDPHVVMVQHQPGLLSWNALAKLLGWPSLGGRRFVVALHNTGDLADIPAELRTRVVAALGGIARVLVHTLADIQRLQEFGLTINVALLPHGATLPVASGHSTSDAPLIGCYGFFLPGKGIGALIEAVATLRERWPTITLRLVNADYGTEASATEIARCRERAEALGVAVEWHTDFLENAQSLELLGQCKVVALPYQASKEASSAALRTALSAGTTVAVTPLPLFDEAGDAVYIVPGTEPGEIAAGLHTLLANSSLRQRVEAAAAIWLAERAWTVIGARLGGILRGLAANCGTEL